jgi:hypothetical protein
MPIGTIIWRTLLAAFLLSLFFIAFNFFGWMFWAAGFVIVLAAFTHLVNEARRARRVPLLVISLATIALFFGACANHVRAIGQLSKDTRSFAEEMHAQCNRDGVCPPAEKVCSPESYGCRDAGSLGIKMSIRYQVAEGARSFSVRSSLTTDDATIYEGGVARALTRRDEIDGLDENGENRPGRVIIGFDAGIVVDAGEAPGDGGSP